MKNSKIFLTFSFAVIALIMATSTIQAAPIAPIKSVDVCVYGGTSAGVIAAYTAKKHGKSVLLIEPTTHIGGMSSGGLGRTEVRPLQEGRNGRRRRVIFDSNPIKKGEFTHELSFFLMRWSLRLSKL